MTLYKTEDVVDVQSSELLVEVTLRDPAPLTHGASSVLPLTRRTLQFTVPAALALRDGLNRVLDRSLDSKGTS